MRSRKPCSCWSSWPILREATPATGRAAWGSRATVYRLLGSLEALDLVEAGAQSGTFRLGWKLMRLGAAVIERLDTERQAALPVMERIHEATGETVFLLVRRGDDAVCIERLEGYARAVAGAPPRRLTAPPRRQGPRALAGIREPRPFWEAYARRGKEFEGPTGLGPHTRDELFAELDLDARAGLRGQRRGRDERESPRSGRRSSTTPAGFERLSWSSGVLKQLVLGDDQARILELLVTGAREVSAALGFTAG